ncbi:RNA polymerase sigma factor [Lysinibacillus sp. FSL H8-0500]|uniref:RNA polymerase sigma factor n=1 Tax=Lysinibacillus sp. FSL H8-0500 TaxID=2921393 RepID=UPI0031015494
MEDEKIVALYIQRSQQAIAETKDKYGAYCKVIARNILSSYRDIEECENDTYLAAWHTIPPTIPKRLAVFLGKIMRNIALDRYSYNTAKKRNPEFNMILAELEECIASPYTVETEYEAGEIAKYISQFLYTIDQQSRNLFIHRYWYSYSIAEFAIHFQMSSSKVKSRLFRTRNKLRFYLEEEGVQL